MGNPAAIRRLVEMPQCPHASRYLWEIFLSISQTRNHNGYGYNPITYLEIASFCSLRNVRLDAWELDALLELDALFLASANKRVAE